MQTTILADAFRSVHAQQPAHAAVEPIESTSDSRRKPSRTAPPTWRVAYELSEARGLERPLAERFIATCYRRNFRAHVDAFMPRLFMLRDAVGAIRGALGLRAAASGRLFVERYCDEPIESAIRRIEKTRAERGAIVEVGHFAGLMPGTMRLLIALLTERLHREGTEWVAFAGTRSLRNTFLRMGLVPTVVCAAQPQRLSSSERAAWGTYYEQHPSVYVGHVGVGARALQPHVCTIAEIAT